MDINLSKYYHLKRFKLALSFILVIVTLVISSLTLVSDFENKLLDYRFSHWSGTTQADSNIIIISIDDGSLDFFANNGVSWPWPRSFYSHLIDYLTVEGAQTIVFDMLFSHADADRSDTDATETDAQFAESIRSGGNVILGSILTELQSQAFTGPIELSIDESCNTLTDSILELPIQVLLSANPGLGHTNIEPDGDGIIRHIIPIAAAGKYSIPSLAIASYIHSRPDVEISSKRGDLDLGELSIPLNHTGAQLINWYGPAGPTGVFKYISFQSVIQSASALKFGGIPSIPTGSFANKIVFIGADAAGLRDLKPTPIMQNGMHPGMEIWTTVLSNYLNEDFIYPVPKTIFLILLLGLSFSVLLSFDRLKPRYGFLIILSQFATYIGVAYVLWVYESRFLLPIAPAVFVSLLSYLLVFSNEMRERIFLKRVFGPYIAPELMQLMYQTREAPALGGQQVNGSAFFSDLQGFTKFSEKLSPVRLVSLLNEYLTDMTDSLMDLRGTLDKYEGDAIIAFFGAPVTDSEHAHQAVKAAITMQQGLADLRKKWDSEGDDWPPEIRNLQMRIGINSGEMLVGNVGSKGRMNFTMMGDTVNVAARLESSAKQYGVLTHISEATALQMPSEIILRKLGATRLVGKENAAVSYEVFGYANDLSAEDMELLKLWPTALEAVEAQKWALAIDLFNQTLALERQYTGRPTNPSEVYLNIRIPGWQSQQLEDNWTPIWIFDSK